ncbi:hypothetical protein [[Clostridium] polysaccharolyticum]|uniref:Uncharacterized protein n=1 Tax=[Clostridium] polysaccharolyticum TaxID=29364 RepID=A0A1I0BEA9_9FIRM|nr:hypothetical protein [[Clostridium] polysaccharolyticum]SET05291.1 hypothetical protein SAMN04487772_10799 [[Clostridium] polysaccharolyticum]
MGKCINCGAPALDDEEYCEACLLLHDLGLDSDSENHDDMFENMDGLLPSEDPETDSSDLNVDEDIMNFLDAADEEPQELTDDSILSLTETPASEEEPQGITDDDILSLIDSPASEEEPQGITDDDILSLTDSPASEEEPQGITDDDILSLIDSPASEGEPQGITDDDILSLIDNPASEEEPQGITDDDILALGEETLEDSLQSNKSSDVGDILSDALGVLNDSAMDDMEKQIMELLPEEEKDKAKKKSKKKEKQSKEKQSKEKQPKEKQPKEEQSLWKRLFSNVPGPEPDPDAPSEEELEAQKQAEKEEKQKEKAAKKAKQKEAKEDRKKAVQEQKAAKIAEKKRLKEEEEKNTPVDTSRINKVGASIVFVLAACLAVFILIGTNTFTYSNGVNSAKDYFKEKQYTKAYQSIAGIKIKAKDEKTYEKIATVMYVNREYDSYYNFYNMEMYPQSLDSLIKGLKRYDKCKESASELEVLDDLDNVKSNIVGSLKDSFNLNENEVQYLVSMDSNEQYRKEIKKLAKAS